MTIEITKKTFDLLFDNSNFSDNDSEETYNKEYYFNYNIDQKGIVIDNFINNIRQYYLLDINS